MVCSDRTGEKADIRWQLNPMCGLSSPGAHTREYTTTFDVAERKCCRVVKRDTLISLGGPSRGCVEIDQLEMSFRSRN